MGGEVRGKMEGVFVRKFIFLLSTRSTRFPLLHLLSTPPSDDETILMDSYLPQKASY